MKEGWLCPRCGKINAPFAFACDCKPEEAISNVKCKEHEWVCCGVTTGGTTYICKKCGKTYYQRLSSGEEITISNETCK